MNDKASITALMSAFGRAYHAENEVVPIFADNIAMRFMTDEEFEDVKGYILGGADFFESGVKNRFPSERELLLYLVNNYIALTPLCRSAYCEEALKTAFKTGTQQYVILGAGLDSFAFREPEILRDYAVFEVDHPKTQEDKLNRIKQSGLEMPSNLHFASVDFTRDSLTEKLISEGFDKNKKTFFSWLGVSYYLDRDDIEKMLYSLSSFASDGSTLLFDYADETLFLSDIKRVRNMIEMAAAGGEEMKSSFDLLSLDMMLSDYGFMVYEILKPRDIQERFIKPSSADMKAFEHINYVQAVFKKR